MNIKRGFWSGFLIIIFIIVFAQIFGKDPITFYKDSSMIIRAIMISLSLLLILIVYKKEYK